MALMAAPWVAAALAASVVANAALGWLWQAERDKRAAQQAQHMLQVEFLQQEMARSQNAAQLCSERVEQMAAQAKRRAQEVAAARAQAAEQASVHHSRADAVLAAPQAVPGDACASAEHLAQQWLTERGRK